MKISRINFRRLVKTDQCSQTIEIVVKTSLELLSHKHHRVLCHVEKETPISRMENYDDPNNLAQDDYINYMGPF